MTVFIQDTSWKWLSEVKNAKDSDLLHKIEEFLSCDFEQAFEVIRTQKLLSRSRSLEITEALCLELMIWAKTAVIANKEKNKLIRHCKLTVGFQSMMSSIREETDRLDIWHLAFSDFAPILVGSIDATNIAFSRQMEEHLQAPDAPDYFELNSTKNWLTRGMLDYSLLVLNEGRKRCSTKSDFTIGNPQAFTQSLQLAKETVEVITAWDHYSFARGDLSVLGEEIRLSKPDTQTAIRRGNYRKRMMELDISHRNSAMQRISMLADKIQQEIGATDSLASFDDFLASEIGKNVLKRLLRGTRIQEEQIASLLEKLFDLDAEVRIGRLRHVYRDLVTIWAYLMRIAIASKIWGELIHAATAEYPKTTITMERLQETFVGLRELSEESIAKGILQFSSFTNQRDAIDLFYAPLLHFTEHEILIPANYILASRFDRNLISIIARLKSDSLAIKGKKPLRKLRSLFEAGGFRCLENIDIRDKEGHLLTDLDLLVYREGAIFFFQSKVLSIPDSPYEYWRVDQTLLSAALQMDLVLSHKSQIELKCQRDDPSFTLMNRSLTAYLLTDVMVHSGFTLKGYLVVDFDYLEHLLRGANLAILDIFQQETVGSFSEISGDFPSPVEIQRLISELSRPKASRLKGNSKMQIQRGSWTLTMDAKGFV